MIHGKNITIKGLVPSDQVISDGHLSSYLFKFIKLIDEIKTIAYLRYSSKFLSNKPRYPAGIYFICLPEVLKFMFIFSIVISVRFVSYKLGCDGETNVIY